jgi:hypothetical protein
MAVYNRYRVLTTSIRLTLVNSAATFNKPIAVAIYPSNVNTPVSSWTLAAE